jgi:hypothetical protein
MNLMAAAFAWTIPNQEITLGADGVGVVVASATEVVDAVDSAVATADVDAAGSVVTAVGEDAAEGVTAVEGVAAEVEGAHAPEPSLSLRGPRSLSIRHIVMSFRARMDCYTALPKIDDFPLLTWPMSLHVFRIYICTMFYNGG